MLTREALKSLIIDTNLETYLDGILQTAHPSLSLVIDETTEENELAVGVSKLGGRPDMPAGMTWPVHTEQALWFIGQIRLDEMDFTNIDDDIPPHGMLYFFYRDDYPLNQPLRLWESWRWAVFYSTTSDPIALERRAWPDSIGSGMYRPCRWRPKPELTIPSFDSHAAYYVLNLSWNDLAGPQQVVIHNYLKLEDKVQQLGKGHRQHQMFGHPSPIQGRVFVAAEEFARQSTERIGFTEQLAEWRLLLQVDTDDRAGMMFGDVGRLYYCIRHTDLAAARFDKTVCIMECT